MADTGIDSLNIRNYTSTSANTDVNVVGMAPQAIKGIIEAINLQSKHVRDLQAEIDRLNRIVASGQHNAEKTAESQSKQNEEALVRSEAAERRQRAADNALNAYMKQNNKLSTLLVNTLKDSIDEIASIIKNGLAKSAQSYSNMAKELRTRYFTEDKRNEIGNDASAIKNLTKSLYNANVSQETANKAIIDAMDAQQYGTYRTLQDSQKAAYVILKQQGMDTVEAMTKASTMSKEMLQEYMTRRTDIVVRGTQDALSKLVSQVDIARRYGGADAATKKILDVSEQLVKYTGRYTSDETRAELGKLFLDLKTGNLAGVDKQALEDLLSVGIGDISKMNEEEFARAINEQIDLAGKNEETANKFFAKMEVFQKSENVGRKKFYDEMTIGVQQYRAGNRGTVEIRNKAENEEAFSAFSENGQLAQTLDSAVSAFDEGTGGFVTKLATGLDEVFGDQLDMSKLVSNGFKVVTGLLSVIANPFKNAVAKAGAAAVGQSLTTAATAVGGGSLLTRLKNRFSKGGEKAAAEVGEKVAAGAGEKAGAKVATKGAKAIKFAKYAGAVGLVGYIGYKLFSGGSSEEESQQSRQLAASITKTSQLSGEFYSDMLSLVEEIRDALVSPADEALSANLTGRTFSEDNLAIADALASATTNPLEKMANNVSKNFSTKMSSKLAANSETMAKLYEWESRVGKNISERAASLFSRGGAAVSEVGEQAAAQAGEQVAAKAGLKGAAKIVGKAAGPAGLAIQAGIGAYEVGSLLSDANELAASGKDLTRELYMRRAALDKARKNNDVAAQKRLELETKSIESMLDKVALEQEAATDEAVVKGAGAVGGILGGVAGGAAMGAAIGTIVPGIGNAVGAVIGGVAGGIAGAMGAEFAATLAVTDTPEQRAEKIRQKREEYQAELRAREDKALKEGLTEFVATSLVASSENQDVFESKLEGLVQMNKLGLDEMQMAFLAENANSTEEMRNITKQMLSDPEKIYNNVASIAVDVSAMRTNLMSVYHRVNEIEDGLKNNDLLKFAEGGIVKKTTHAIVGEDGTEAIVPLEKPDEMRRVVGNLSAMDKLRLLRALIAKRNGSTLGAIASALFSVLGIGREGEVPSSIMASAPAELNLPSAADGVPGDDPATLEKILSFAGAARGLVYERLLHGWKGNVKDGFAQRKKWYEEALRNAANQDGRDLIRGTYAERALDYGVAELGKPYILRSLGKIGYVCNELVNAAIQASGFSMGKFRVNGVKATFANIQKGKMTGEGYPNFRIRDDLTPQTAIPGMVFFQDARKNQEGGFQPGHIGFVYYGHQKLHAAGGSADYTKEGFLPNWQTPCRGVTVTPFDGSNYVIGEFPGLFEKATGEWKPPTNAPVSFGPSGSGLLTEAEMQAIINEAGLSNSYVMRQYFDQVKSLATNNNKDEIIAVLLEIARSLKGVASNTKKPIMPATLPAAPVYGT